MTARTVTDDISARLYDATQPMGLVDRPLRTVVVSSQAEIDAVSADPTIAWATHAVIVQTRAEAEPLHLTAPLRWGVTGAGAITVHGRACVHAYGSVHATVPDEGRRLGPSVHLHDQATAEAWSGVVHAWGSGRAVLHGDAGGSAGSRWPGDARGARITATDPDYRGSVTLIGHAHAVVGGRGHLTASDHSSAVLRGQARGRGRGHAHLDLYGEVLATREGEVTVSVHEQATCLPVDGVPGPLALELLAVGA